jgi:hypothetical protein
LPSYLFALPICPRKFSICPRKRRLPLTESPFIHFGLYRHQAEISITLEALQLPEDEWAQNLKARASKNVARMNGIQERLDKRDENEWSRFDMDADSSTHGDISTALDEMVSLHRDVAGEKERTKQRQINELFDTLKLEGGLTEQLKAQNKELTAELIALVGKEGANSEKTLQLQRELEDTQRKLDGAKKKRELEAQEARTWLEEREKGHCILLEQQREKLQAKIEMLERESKEGQLQLEQLRSKLEHSHGERRKEVEAAQAELQDLQANSGELVEIAKKNAADRLRNLVEREMERQRDLLEKLEVCQEDVTAMLDRLFPQSSKADWPEGVNVMKKCASDNMVKLGEVKMRLQRTSDADAGALNDTHAELSLVLGVVTSLHRDLAAIHDRQRKRVEDLESSKRAIEKVATQLETKNQQLEVTLAALPKQESFEAETRERARLEEELVETRRKLQEEKDKQLEHDKKIESGDLLLERMQQMMRGEMSKMTTAVVQRIDEKFENLKVGLDDHTKGILQAIFDVDEVQCPTSFIIVPFELEGLSSDEQETKLQSWLQALGDMSATLQEGWETIQAAKDAIASKELNRGIVGCFRKFAGSFLGQYSSKKTYLYLLDEVTGDIVRGEPYPIKIKSPTKTVKKFLPLMKLGINAICALNLAAGAAKLCGIPAPSIPDSLKSSAESYVEELSKKSSVEDYDVLQSHLDVLDAEEDGKLPETRGVRGPELREFAEFLEKVDPHRRFCGLSRVRDVKTSKAVWTTQEGVNILEAREVAFEQEKAKLAEQRAFGNANLVRSGWSDVLKIS